MALHSKSNFKTYQLKKIHLEPEKKKKIQVKPTNHAKKKSPTKLKRNQNQNPHESPENQNNRRLLKLSHLLLYIQILWRGCNQ